MVAPQPAFAGTPRSPRGGAGTSLLAPGIAVAFLAIPVSIAIGLVALFAPADLGPGLGWSAWAIATALGGVAALGGIAAAEPGRERAIRAWLGAAFALGACWAFSTAVLRVAGDISAGSALDFVLVAAAAAGLLPFVELMARLPRADRIALVLDAACVFLAIISVGAAATTVATGVRGGPLWVSVYPIAFLVIAAFAAMIILATQTRFAARGLNLVFAGVVLLALAVFVWICQWLGDPDSIGLASGLLAPAAPLIGIGVATAGREFDGDARRARRPAWYLDGIPLVAVGLTAILMLLESAGVFTLPMLRVTTVLVVAVAIAREAILLGARTSLVRRLLVADEQTREALRRAAAAEGEAVARAAQLAAVLDATSQMRLASDVAADCGRVLDALTPSGATSFLALATEPGFGPEVTAISGPLAPAVAAIEPPVHDGAPAADHVHVRYYSASGQVLSGQGVAPGRTTPLIPDLRAVLAVDLLDHEGSRLGTLHLLDPLGERILEPTQVGLTQLVAAQIGAAVETRALLDRLQSQLDEVQRVQRELLQATKLGAVAELAAAVAHEVNNPLTGILGFAELLLAELPAGDPRRDEVAVIRTEAVRAREIVRALLELARPRPPQRVAVNLNVLAHASCELLRYRIEDAGIRVVEDYAVVPPVHADPDAMRQVLLNLLNNAVEAMPGGGELRLTTRRVRDRVMLSVEDNGIGMSDDTRQKVFTPFFTMRPGTPAEIAGSGLGLAVSLQIVESHGGTIEVESELGAGSTFTLELPIGRPETADAEGGAGSEMGTGDGEEVSPRRAPADGTGEATPEVASEVAGRLRRSAHAVSLSGEEAER